MNPSSRPSKTSVSQRELRRQNKLLYRRQFSVAQKLRTWECLSPPNKCRTYLQTTMSSLSVPRHKDWMSDRVPKHQLQ